ncbi:MAG: toxin-antitoxin system toxin subunit [Verrucomicrobiaceae bacterium]|nr:MAG: toxin-antitoxin system toxin subunit [Verrucomicrobiaceae bacterium]
MTLAILFSRTRAEIFRLLFEDPARESHLRDLAREAGLSPAALQRELTSLAGSGLILSRRDGNRHYFKANTAHPWYADLHGLVSKTTGIVPALKNVLVPLDGIEFAFIFGSIAAGHASTSSDVDLLILGSIGLRKLTPALRGLSQTFSRELNPYCMTTEEWRRKRRENDAFAARVTREPKFWLKGDADVFDSMGF